MIEDGDKDYVGTRLMVNGYEVEITSPMYGCWKAKRTDGNGTLYLDDWDIEMAVGGGE